MIHDTACSCGRTLPVDLSNRRTDGCAKQPLLLSSAGCVESLVPTARSRSRLRERLAGRERERVRAEGHNQHRAPTCPERAASAFPVSPATQPRPSRGEASRKPPDVWDRNGRSAGVEGTFTLARQPARYRRQAARNGRCRATRRAAAASGAGRRETPLNRARRSVTHSTSYTVGHKYVNMLVDVRGHASRRPRNSHRSGGITCVRQYSGLILPAVSLSRISPPRGGEYPHEVTAGSIRKPSAARHPAPRAARLIWCLRSRGTTETASPFLILPAVTS